MAYNNEQKDTRPNAPFDLHSLTKWAPSTAQGKSAMFKVDVDLAGKVTLMVLTGDPADKERSKDGHMIKIKLGPEDFEKFVINFGDALRAKGECKYFLVEQVKFQWDKNAGKRVPLETPRDGIKLVFGKDSAGIMFISLVQYKKTEIEFGFLVERPEFLWKHSDGTPYSNAENSVLGARAYHKLLTELNLRIEASRIRQHQTPDAYKPPYVPGPPGGGAGGGSGGGGYNKGGNGGGGGYGGGGQTQKAAPDFSEMDDEIPY